MNIYLETELSAKVLIVFSDYRFLQMFLQRLYNEISLLKDREHSYFQIGIYGAGICLSDGFRVLQMLQGDFETKVCIQELSNGKYCVVCEGQTIPLKTKNKAFVREILRSLYTSDMPEIIQFEAKRLCMLTGIKETEFTPVACVKRARTGSLLSKLKRH